MSDNKQTLGKYQLQRLIGRGSAGSVFLATVSEPTPGHIATRVAIKRLNRISTADEIERLRREAATMSAIDHPNILQVIEVIPDGENVALVLPYAAGGTLTSQLEASGPLTPKSLLSVIVPIGQALAAAHGCGVLHRDVKPSNILFTISDKPLLSDFGIAFNEQNSSLTSSGVTLGTAAYLDPEVADGHSASWSSDLYSLGVVAFEALHGHPPFMGDTPLAILRRADKGEIAGPRVATTLDAVIRRAIVRRPEDRWSSVAEFVDVLSSDLESLTPAAISKKAPESRFVESKPSSSEHEVALPDVFKTTAELHPGSPGRSENSPQADRWFEEDPRFESDYRPEFGRNLIHQPHLEPQFEPQFESSQRLVDDTTAFRRHSTSSEPKAAKTARFNFKHLIGLCVAVVAAAIGVALFQNPGTARQSKPGKIKELALPRCSAETNSQCVAKTLRTATGVRVEFANGLTGDYQLGKSTDLVRVNNFFCGERATLALYEQDTGRIYYLSDWPDVNRTEPSRTLFDDTGIAHAERIWVADHNGDKCADLAVDHEGTRTWFEPNRQTGRLSPTKMEVEFTP